MDQEDLVQIYFSEAEELLQIIEKSVMALEADTEDQSLVKEIFRAVHTMKSSAAMVGFNQLSEHAHLLENLLEKLRTQQLPVTRNLVSFLLENHDLIKTMVEDLSQNKPEMGSSALLSMHSRIKELLGQSQATVEKPVRVTDAEKAADGSREKFYQIQIKLRKDIFQQGPDPLILLYELGDVGELCSVETDISTLPPFLEMNIYDLYLSWKIMLKTTKPLSVLEQVFIFVKEDPENQITMENVSDYFKDGVDIRLASKPLGEILVDQNLVTPNEVGEVLSQQKRVGEALVEDGKLSQDDLDRVIDLQEKSRVAVRKSTVRVGTDKLDHLANMVEEMTVQLAHVSTVFQEMPLSVTKKLRSEMDILSKTGREVQEQVMRLRMFPIEGTFQRFQRMALDLAREQNKQAKILIGGGETELDKDVIEQISDPLKHLVRNCLDHGLEAPEERKRLGKSPEATISFNAYQQEGQIYIEICDDGRGIDENRVRQKAIDLGLITEKDQPQTEDLYQFLFLPGFSTAREVSSISGRGVGMDVVQNNVQRLGGTIQIFSRLGMGTKFIIKLPLTLAVIDGMYVRVGSEIYIIPLSSVLSTSKLKKGEIKTIEAKGEMARFGDTYAPLVYLDKVLCIGNTDLRPEPLIVFVTGDKKIMGLVVDEILDQQQVVIKNLEKNFRKIPAIAGGAIMPDGSVALIIDVHSLDYLFFEQERGEEPVH